MPALDRREVARDTIPRTPRKPIERDRTGSRPRIAIALEFTVDELSFRRFPFLLYYKA